MVVETDSSEGVQCEAEGCGVAAVAIFLFMRGLMSGRRSIGFRRPFGCFLGRYPAA